MNRTPGQQDYEAELAKKLNYHDGSPRRPWSELSDLARWSWDRGAAFRTPDTQDPAMEPVAYRVDANDLVTLERVAGKLHGNGASLSATQRRDLANTMRAVVERIRNAPVRVP